MWLKKKKKISFLFVSLFAFAEVYKHNNVIMVCSSIKQTN